MTKASDNLFPGIIIRESADDGSDFTNPTADYRRLFVGEDGDLHLKDSSGTVTDFPSGGGSGAPTDATYLTTSANGSLSNEVVVTAPASGGVVAKIVRKTSNETVNGSDTLQNDDALLLALLANEVWQFELIALITSGATPDFKCAFTVPASATVEWGAQGTTNAAGSTWATSMVTGSGTSRDFIMGSGTRMLQIVGYVANSTNTGNLQFQWAQNTSNASDTIVLANSVLKAWKLA